MTTAPDHPHAHVNLPEFARRAGIPYPTMYSSYRDGRLPDPTISADSNGGSPLWKRSVADKWIKDQGSTPVDGEAEKPYPEGMTHARTYHDNTGPVS